MFLTSALLNTAQQIGAAIGLAVLTTVAADAGPDPVSALAGGCGAFGEQTQEQPVAS